MWAEIGTAVGAGLGAFIAAFAGAKKLSSRRKTSDPPGADFDLAADPNFRALLASVDRIDNRDQPPDLSERVTRLEDDVRENATATANRLDSVMTKLGELRGMLRGLKGDE